ncbi:MAG: M2 family metallopeptidase [Actinomycetota bacterium]|nr:M2 family metallopeptidase [Actinomycetota bacterium]
MAPHRMVEALEQKIADLEIAFHRAWWDSQTEASEANEKRRSELELELRRVKGDPEALRAVEDALAEGHHEPLFQRQLEVLRLSLTGNQMDESHRTQMVELSSAVEGEFATFRPELDGRPVSENDIEEILRTANDVDVRERAWSASKEIGVRVADRIRELARVRNEAARALGFADFYRMSLELQEIPEDWLFNVLGQLDALTAGPFQEWKAELDGRLRERFGVSDLWPWHYADPFFQSLPPEGRVGLDPLLESASASDLARDTFASWSINIEDVLAASDLYPRTHKSQHAFCIDIDRSGADVRILANVVPGERWVEIMLHESGHAAYDVSIDPKLPFLLRRAAHTFTTEAAALLSGRLVRDPEWLLAIAGCDPDDVAKISDDLRTENASQSLVFARWGLVMTHFERDLYSDPEADLDARWWELVERFQGVRVPAPRDTPDWAAKIHLAAAPVYYQNYLLGDLLASQLKATIESRFGGLVKRPEVGGFLIDEYFRPGASLRWDALVESATGAPLAADAFAAELGA